MAACGVHPLRIVLVGKTGSGKSATANTILGEKRFASKTSVHSVTKECQKASRKWGESDLLVVDTPGLFVTKESLETTSNEINQCIIYSCPGPHAIILVLQLGRYTQEEQNMVALIKDFFGKAVMKHMIVLFTRKEELEDSSLKDFIEETDERLRSLIQECGDRCLAFNNLAGQVEKEDQVQELVGLIEKMVRDNGGTYFSNVLYKDMEEKLKKQADFLQEKYADQLQKEVKLVEEEYTRKHNKILQELQEEKQLIQKTYEEKMKNAREEAEKSIFGQIVDEMKKYLSSVLHFFK